MKFDPKTVYFEPDAMNYPLGKYLQKKYENKNWIPIENHNNIPELRARDNCEFPKLKQNLIIGIRKTQKFVPNKKISDFLVPYTSSGCSAMCLYCYLVCHYNKCAYLRLFVNREQMLEKVLRTSRHAERPLTFEIGSNSDLVLENTITGNLGWTIEQFAKEGRGFLTFPTKFAEIEPLLPLSHGGKTIARMSVNPAELIRKVELGTAPLTARIRAINLLCEAGYPVGLLIAPIMLVEGWEKLYTELLNQLADELSPQVKKTMRLECIFMTYSYVHRQINEAAFPNAVRLYDANLMTGRGPGKYWYRAPVRAKAELFFRESLKLLFPEAQLIYIV